MSRQAIPRALSRIIVCLAATACGPEGDSSAADTSMSSGNSLPDDYELRLDRSNRDPANFRVSLRDAGIEVRTGPSGILYRRDQAVDGGDFVVSATFTEVGAPLGHREGFGLFVGGQALEGDDQRYTYFLVRADGKYVIKHRTGESTEELSNGWIPSESVRVAAMEDGDVSNDLAISVASGRVRFVCNGEVVADLAAAGLSISGIVGVRVNHNLVVRIENFRIEG